MPRPPRVWFPGAWYHLMARGNNKEPIFFAERDYRKYLQLLSETVQRYECLLHAYVLMTNHVHLMIETGSSHPIWKPVHLLHTSYTSYVNHAYGRVGHIFQGRYRSIVVERDVYALELGRYIHLNPVRAHLVTEPSAYPWSSYHAYVGCEGEGRGLVTTHQLLGMLSPQPTLQRERYRQFVLEGLAVPQDLMREVTDSQFLASPAFVEQASVGPSGVRPRVRPRACPRTGVRQVSDTCLRPANVLWRGR